MVHHAGRSPQTDTSQYLQTVGKRLETSSRAALKSSVNSLLAKQATRSLKTMKMDLQTVSDSPKLQSIFKRAELAFKSAWNVDTRVNTHQLSIGNVLSKAFTYLTTSKDQRVLAKNITQHLLAGGKCSDLINPKARAATIFEVMDCLPALESKINRMEDGTEKTILQKNLNNLKQISHTAKALKASNESDQRVNQFAAIYLKMCDDQELLASLPKKIDEEDIADLLKEEEGFKKTSKAAEEFVDSNLNKLQQFERFCNDQGIKFRSTKSDIPEDIVLSTILREQNGASDNPWPVVIQNRLVAARNDDPAEYRSQSPMTLNSKYLLAPDELKEKYPTYEAYEKAFDKAHLNWQAYVLLYNNKVPQPGVNVEKQTMNLVRVEANNKEKYVFTPGDKRAFYVSTFRGKPGNVTELDIDRNERCIVTVHEVPFHKTMLGNHLLGIPCKSHKEREIPIETKGVKYKTYTVTYEELQQWEASGDMPKAAKRM